MEALPGLFAQLIESIRLSKMYVVDWDTRRRRVLVLGVLRAGIGHQRVEKPIVAFVLSLFNVILAKAESTILQSQAYLCHATREIGKVSNVGGQNSFGFDR